MASAGVKNYMTTLILCIVMVVFAVALFGLLFTKVIPETASYFVVTIVIGLIFVSSIALYSIISYEKKLKQEAANLTKGRLDVVVCPDFYTRSNNDICLNSYTTGDGLYTYSVTGGSNIDLGKYLNKPMDDVCKFYAQDAFKNGINVPSSNVIPWTYLNTKCDVI